eukprot:6193922-Pleurochrysis_carterae.AAC.1
MGVPPKYAMFQDPDLCMSADSLAQSGSWLYLPSFGRMAHSSTCFVLPSATKPDVSRSSLWGACRISG